MLNDRHKAEHTPSRQANPTEALSVALERLEALFHAILSMIDEGAARQQLICLADLGAEIAAQTREDFEELGATSKPQIGHLYPVKRA